MALLCLGHDFHALESCSADSWPTGGTSLRKDGSNSRRTVDYSHKSLSAGVSTGKAVKAVGGMCAVQTRVPEFESPTHMACQA